MEVIKRGRNAAHKFKVVKPFRWGGYITEKGQEIEIRDPEATGQVQNGRVVPSDIPAEGEYVCITDIVLPGREAKHEAKRLEKVLLKSEDALRLMLAGSVLPTSEDQWRPNGRRLLRGADRSAEKRAKMDKIMLEDQMFKLGIHPSMTKK